MIILFTHRYLSIIDYKKHRQNQFINFYVGTFLNNTILYNPNGILFTQKINKTFLFLVGKERDHSFFSSFLKMKFFNHNDPI